MSRDFFLHRTTLPGPSLLSEELSYMASNSREGESEQSTVGQQHRENNIDKIHGIKSIDILISMQLLASARC
jgi:hypothetical protein